MTPEGHVQSKIAAYAKKAGYLVLRFEVMQMVGFPDLLLLGHGRVAFIEVKAPGKKPGKIQHYRLKQINDRGIPADWFDNIDDAKVFINEIVRTE